MTSHRPKTAALLAYAEDLLSADGRRRVEGHLAGCAICRAELAAIELYEQMIDDVDQEPMPEIDFSRMELPLAREAERISREIRAGQRRSRALPWALIAAAAAALLAFWGWPRESAAPIAEHVEPAPAPEAPVQLEAEFLAPIVTLSAGAAHLGDSERVLLPGDEVPEGAALRTGEDGSLHVRLRDGTAIGIAHDTIATLTRAREDEIRLELERGTLNQEVAHLESGSRYVVLCAGYEVEVTGTRFVVSYLEGVVGVDLAEGSLDLRTPEGETIPLEAPARWRSSGSAAQGESEVVESELVEPEVPALRRVSASEDTETLVTLRDERLVRWEVDGSSIASEGDVRLTLAPGEHEIRAWDAQDRPFALRLPVVSTPMMIEPEAMQAEVPQIRAGHLDPDQIRPTLERATRSVQRCYVRALREPGVSFYGRVRLRIDLTPMGDARRARVLDLRGNTGSFQACVQSASHGWAWPAPRGPLTLQASIQLVPTM